MPERTGRHAALAKIHIARKALGMPDRAYRALLLRETGAESAADLDDAGLRKVLARFEALGWSPSRAAARPHGAAAQRRRIARTLDELGLPAAYGEAIAERMRGRPIALLAPAELRGVQAALEARRRRLEEAP